MSAVGTEEHAREMAELASWVARPPTTGAVPRLEPLNLAERSGNELRPASFDEMVGQRKLVPLLKRLVQTSRATGRPLDHMLLLGSAGTGKTTCATVIAHELGRDVYVLKAPVAVDVLAALADRASDGDVVFVDEIHQQSHGDRRGVTQAADPEVFYSLMEDHRLTTATGVREFPVVTLVGATTDAGLLPEAFLARFPLQPRLDPYTVEDMTELAAANARSLRISLDSDGARTFARASRGIPRIVNRYVRNARSLNASRVNIHLAEEIVIDLNGVTLDGLDRDHQNMLKFLLASPRITRGETVYQASIGSIATACGKSRDQKAIALLTEPYLIERGLVAVTHGGRQLTAAGVERARAL